MEKVPNFLCRRYSLPPVVVRPSALFPLPIYFNMKDHFNHLENYSQTLLLSGRRVFEFDPFPISKKKTLKITGILQRVVRDQVFEKKLKRSYFRKRTFFSVKKLETL
jgi:hypothetical protein